MITSSGTVTEVAIPTARGPHGDVARRRIARAVAVTVAAVAAVTWAALTSSEARAASEGPQALVAVQTASGKPGSYFAVEGRPGRRVRLGVLVVSNQARHPITVAIDPVTARTGATLGSVYDNPGTAVSGPARWLKLSARRIVVPAASSRSVSATAVVPAGTGPGDYLGGISVEALHQNGAVTQHGRLAIASVVRYAVGAEVAIPGRRYPLLRFTGARVEALPHGVVFLLGLANPGNVILTNVAGAVQVSRQAHPVADGAIGPGTFIAGSAINFPLSASRLRPSVGDIYRVRAWVRYAGRIARLDTTVRVGSDVVATQNQYLPRRGHGGGVPWLIVGTALLVIVLGTVLFSRRRSPRSRLARTLQAHRSTGDPLSLVVFAAGKRPLDRGSRSVFRSRLRRGDWWFADPERLVVVLPRTAEASAQVIAEDLVSRLPAQERDSVKVFVRSYSSGGDPLPNSVDELLRRPATVGAR